MAIDILVIPAFKDSFETPETTWQDVIRLPASVFAASGKYALMVTCGVDSNGDDTDDLDGAIQVRVVHGSTAFDESTALLLPTRPELAPAFHRHYGWMDVFTQGGTPEQITLQIKRYAVGDATHQVYATDISIIAICLDNLVENTDYWFDENDDTGSPLALTAVNQTITSRTFTAVGGSGRYAAVAAFIFCNIRCNNTDVATKLDLARTEANENSSIVRHWTLSQQSAMHADEQHSMLIPDGVMVGDTNDSFFQLALAEVGSPAVHHEHMITRVFSLRFADTFTAGLSGTLGFEQHGDIFLPLSRTVGLTPKNMTAAGTLHATAQYQFLSCRASVTPFQGSYQTSVWLASLLDGEPYTEANADANICLPNFYHVVGDNVDALDITPQVRLMARGYGADSVIRRPLAFLDNGDFGSTVIMSNFEVGNWQFEDFYHFVDDAASLPAMTAAGVATTDNPAHTASGTGAMPPMAAAGEATAAVIHIGIGIAALPELDGDGTATATMPSYASTAAPDLPGMTAAGVATFTIPAIDNEGAATLPAIAAAGDAEMTYAACDAFEYEQYGRQPIGVSQDFAYGANYPLIAPSADVKYLLADFFLSYDDPTDYDTTAREFEPPFQLIWIFGAGCIPNGRPDFVAAEAFHAFDVIVADANGRIVFDSTAAEYVGSTWSDRLDVHEWTSDAGTCRAVVHTKWFTAAGQPVPQNYDIHITPDNGVLDPRCVLRMPRRVRSLIVGDDTLQGEISWENGYNTEYSDEGAISDPIPLQSALGITLTAGAEGGRAGRRYGISAVAGSGLGRYPGCDNISLDILTVNNVEPDEYGNLIFNSEDCYWFEQPVDRDTVPAVRTAATLTIHNDCVPCCDCDDMVQVKMGIDSLYARWTRIVDEAIRIREVYNANRARWVEDVACRLANQNQRVQLTTNCLGYVGIGYSFCTQSDDCEGPLSVTFDIIVNPIDGERPNPDPDDPPFDTDTDGNNIPDSDEEATVTGYGPELIANSQFSQGLSGWTHKGATYYVSGSVVMGFNGLTLTDSEVNLLTNPSFAGNTTGWTLTGNAAYTPVAFDYVRVGGGGGGIGKLSQQVNVDDGETYKGTLFFDYSIGTCRLKLIDGNGVETVLALSPTSPPVLGNPSNGEALAFVADGGSCNVLIESEYAASNSVHANRVYLYPYTGTLSQTVTGLTPGTQARLQVNFRVNVVAITASFEDEDGNVLFSEAVPLRGVASTYTKLFTPGTATGIVKIHVEYNSFGGAAEVTAVSLKHVITTGGSSPPGEIDSQYEMRASYIPNSARKNDVTSQRMQPYTMGGAFPTLTATWDKLNPGKSARLTFMAYICNGIDGDSITVTATPTLNGEELESVSDTIALTPDCPTKEELCGDS